MGEETDEQKRARERQQERETYIRDASGRFSGSGFVLSLFGGGDSVGIGGAGLSTYNFFARLINGFVGLFGAGPWMTPIENVGNVIDLMHSSPNNSLRRSVEQTLTRDLGLPESFAQRLLEPHREARDTLNGLIGAAGIELADLRDPAKLREKFFSPAALQYILTDTPNNPADDRAFEMLLQLAPEHARTALREARQAGELSQVNAAALSQALLAPNRGEIGPIIQDHIINALPQKRILQMVDGPMLSAMLSNKDEMTRRFLPYLGDTSTQEKRAALNQSIDFLHRNQSDIRTILGSEGFAAMADILKTNGTLPDMSNLVDLFSKPEFERLRNAITRNALNGNQVEEALGRLNFSSLPEAQRQSAELVAAILSNRSDVAGKSNLDILADLANNQDALHAFGVALTQLTGSGRAGTASAIDATTANRLVDALEGPLTNMDFDAHNIAQRIATHPSVPDALKRAAQRSLTKPEAQQGNEGAVDGLVTVGIIQKINDAAASR